MLASKQLVLLGGNPKPSLDINPQSLPAIPASLTWGRTTIGTVVDFEGLVKPCKVDEARFPGARMVENLLPTSFDIRANGWSSSPGTIVPTLVANGTLLTKNVTTDSRWNRAVSVINSGTYIASAEFIKTVSVNISELYLVFGFTSPTASVSAYIEIDTSTGQTRVRFSAGTYSYCVQTTVDSYILYITLTAPATGTPGGIYMGITPTWGTVIASPDATATGSCTVRSVMFEDVTGQANKAPSERISSGVLAYPYHGCGVDGVKYFATTNPNVVSSNVVTEAVGTPLTGITLLAEEARTNLLSYSQALDTAAYWQTASNVTVTADQVTAPDGTLTADKITEVATTATHRLAANNNTGVTITAGATQTMSAYFKKGSRRYMLLYFSDTGGSHSVRQWYDLDTGLKATNTVVGTNIAFVSATMTAVSNGFYRVALTVTPSTGMGTPTVIYPFFAMADADASITYLGDITQYGYMWGLQMEQAINASSYIPTTTGALTRTADVPSFTGAGLSWYNAQQGTFVIKASGQYSSAPGNIGVWNPLLTGEGTYAITYNKAQDNNAYLYLPNAAAGVNPLEYQDIPTPTTILLGEQGILNISRWTYYPKAFKANKVTSLVSGTLTTAFDVSYAATTDFTNAFRYFPFGSNMKSLPKINSSAGADFGAFMISCTTVVNIASIDVSKGQDFHYAWTGLSNLVTFRSSPFVSITNIAPPSSTTGFFQAWNVDTKLANFPANMFDNCKERNYAEAFNGCALTQQSVDNILVSIAQSVVNTPTLTGGTLNMTGGTNATPSATGLAAKAALVAASWTVTHN